MAKRRVLHIEISSPTDSLRQFADVWQRAGTDFYIDTQALGVD
jgi:hypothetical protein